jgi:hypothetical protein
VWSPSSECRRLGSGSRLRVDFLVPAAVLAMGAVAVYGFQKSGSALIHSSAT